MHNQSIRPSCKSLQMLHSSSEEGKATPKISISTENALWCWELGAASKEVIGSSDDETLARAPLRWGMHSPADPCAKTCLRKKTEQTQDDKVKTRLIFLSYSGVGSLCLWWNILKHQGRYPNLWPLHPSALPCRLKSNFALSPWKGAYLLYLVRRLWRRRSRSSTLNDVSKNTTNTSQKHSKLSIARKLFKVSLTAVLTLPMGIQIKSELKSPKPSEEVHWWHSRCQSGNSKFQSSCSIYQVKEKWVVRK